MGKCVVLGLGKCKVSWLDKHRSLQLIGSRSLKKGFLASAKVSLFGGASAKVSIDWESVIEEGFLGWTGTESGCENIPSRLVAVTFTNRSPPSPLGILGISTTNLPDPSTVGARDNTQAEESRIAEGSRSAEVLRRRGVLRSRGMSQWGMRKRSDQGFI